MRTKARPLLALASTTLAYLTVPASAGAAVPAFTFAAYTAPLPDAHAAITATSALHLAAVAGLFALAAFAAAIPTRRKAPAAAAPLGPVYCARSRRWRDPVTGRLVRAPSV